MSSPIRSGTKLGRYELRSKIGAGGMGEVYKARDTEIGRDVAVKVLPSSFSADRDRLSRFKQEACAAGALNHPNIVVVHDIGAHDGSPYVVSELLEGETLRTADRNRMNRFVREAKAAQLSIIQTFLRFMRSINLKFSSLHCL